MKITMIDSRLTNCKQIKEFLSGAKDIVFSFGNKKEKYIWIKELLDRVQFRKLGKTERGLIRSYVQKITGYSHAQLSRLFILYVSGKILLNSSSTCKAFPVVYTRSDVLLLCKTDNAHSRLNACATKKILIREYQKFGKKEYENISKISISHIYNLRKVKVYKKSSLTFTKTQAVARAIGERRKPQPDGKPGYIRVDSVHQGDSEKAKGVYHINSTDEVTQWEIVASVEKLSVAYLEPILILLLDQYPFVIHEFHADNGSEYINHMVAELLNKLLIKLTKGRSRHCNDNALAEGKNGSVVRKHMGYFYINQKYAPAINEFYQKYFNPYLNYHRPCGYATNIVDKNGKVKKVYKQEDYMNPYEKLKSLPSSALYLKPGVTFEQLDKIAYQHSDNEFAEIMEYEKQKLFDKIVMKPSDF